MPYPQITLIIPTYNESENISPLIQEIDKALLGIDWAIIFVDDDSKDGTVSEIEKFVNSDSRIDCVLRRGTRGLSGAILVGLTFARSPYVAVMDADLQHDPAIILAMLSGLKEFPSKNIAVASRYLEGYGAMGLTRARYFGSRFLTIISQFFISRNLSDPMSGFFLVRREIFSKLAPRISPYGYKILLDLASEFPNKDFVLEYPLAFRERKAGESKMDFRVLWELLILLIYKSTFNVLPRHFLSYSMIGMIGLVVHMAILFLFYKICNLPFNLAQILATTSAMLNNFLLNNYLTYWSSSLHGHQLLYGYLKFAAICSLGGLISFGIADYLVLQGFIWFIAGCLGAIAAAGWNYSLTRFITWNPKTAEIVWLRKSIY